VEIRILITEPLSPFVAAVALVMLASCKSIPVEIPAASSLPVPDMLTDERAARLALENNAAFLELMADLGIAEAEFIQAGELPNPGLAVLFPLGPKQLEFAAKLPVEALWLRPKRESVARSNADMIAKRLMQDGLDLVRDTKIACADLRLAERKAQLAKEDAALLANFADLAGRREEAGDISELEVSTAETDALQARIDRDRAPTDVKIAREKLRNLLGFSAQRADFTLAKTPGLLRVDRSEASLVKLALAARPDLRAAELAMEVEGKRFGLAQAEVFKVAAIFDSNGFGSSFEAGPGLDVTLPIFNNGEGAKALADVRFRKAARHYVSVRDQIAMEVRQFYARYQQAGRDLHAMRDELLPALRRTANQTEDAWKGGEVTYLYVLESNRRLQAARLREAEFLADLQRASAELERSIGASSAMVSGKGVISS